MRDREREVCIAWKAGNCKSRARSLVVLEVGMSIIGECAKRPSNGLAIRLVARIGCGGSGGLLAAARRSGWRWCRCWNQAGRGAGKALDRGGRKFSGSGME